MYKEEFQKIIESITNIKDCKYIEHIWCIGKRGKYLTENKEEIIPLGKKPEFKTLKLLLEKLSPTTPYLYEKIIEELANIEEYEEGEEFDGDYNYDHIEYTKEEIRCDKLYDFLTKNELI